MCARRFLLAITILTLLIVAGAFALFQWGGSALRQMYTPEGHYTAPPPSSAPDYSRMESWIARPGRAYDPARWLPQGVSTSVTGNAAIFYIHPTTYLKGDRWNAPLVDDADTAFRTNLFVQSEASAFNGVGQVWAPRYRQATYGSFLLKSQDAQEALNLAYSDLVAAFDQFLKSIPADQPIIVAGHSQGALHLMRLLEDRKDQLKGRLVAAYVVGWPIDTTSDLPALGFPGCISPTQTGCILSWMSFGDPPNPSLILHDWRKAKGLNGGPHKRKDILCVNPITGTANGTAPPRANPGSLVPSSDFTSATLQPGTVGAHCSAGLLILSGNVPPLGPFVLPGNNYHVYDYALFWGAIRQDSERRVAVWQRR